MEAASDHIAFCMPLGRALGHKSREGRTEDVGSLFQATRGESSDLSRIGPVLDQIPGVVASVLADGGYDAESVYRTMAERQPHPPPAVIIPPRVTAVPSPAADALPSPRDRHIQMIQEKGRTGWQKTLG